MFRWLRWQFAKRRFAALPPSRHSIKLNSSSLGDFPPDTESYEKLASVWNDFHSYGVPQYGQLLSAGQAYYGHPIRTVLDLACGTGLITRQFASWADSVVGLDISEPMLAEARSRTNAGNVRYLRGDFRDFSLGETFDAVTCASNSLNYVQSIDELPMVFQCVRQHLHSGGFLAFDVLDDAGFRALKSVKTVWTVRNKPFEILFFYNPRTRIAENRAVLEGVVERHRRIPIEKQDVHNAALATGFVVEHFSSTPFASFALHYYVLRKLG